MAEQLNNQIVKVGQSFGLEKGLITNLTKSQAVGTIFLQAVADSGLQTAQKKVGNMIYSIATKVTETVAQYRQVLAKHVGSGDIYNASQLDYAIEYLKNKQAKGGVDLVQFAKDCGVGVKLSQQQIQKIIEQSIVDANQDSKKFDFLGKIKEKIPFVEGKLLKDLFEGIWKAKGLPENVVADKKKKPEKAPVKQQAKTTEAAQEEQVFHIKDISQLIGRQMKSALNSKQALEVRNKEFGEIVLTRFPPEPNGYLHIGHCKAMRFNFMQAKVSGGKCYLRFDDTNPLKQNIEYIVNIKENIEFMGYEPWKVTHASDNFEKLYAYAIQLIKQGDAFVCGENIEQMRKKQK